MKRQLQFHVTDRCKELILVIVRALYDMVDTTGQVCIYLMGDLNYCYLY